VSLNDELKLDPEVSNRLVTLETFTGVVLRPADLNSYDPEISRRIVQLCLDRYEEVSLSTAFHVMPPPPFLNFLAMRLILPLGKDKLKADSFFVYT
jgi:hypothetical protein